MNEAHLSWSSPLGRATRSRGAVLLLMLMLLAGMALGSAGAVQTIRVWWLDLQSARSRQNAELALLSGHAWVQSHLGHAQGMGMDCQVDSADGTPSLYARLVSGAGVSCLQNAQGEWASTAILPDDMWRRFDVRWVPASVPTTPDDDPEVAPMTSAHVHIHACAGPDVRWGRRCEQTQTPETSHRQGQWPAFRIGRLDHWPSAALMAPDIVLDSGASVQAIDPGLGAPMLRIEAALDELSIDSRAGPSHGQLWQQVQANALLSLSPSSWVDCPPNDCTAQLQSWWVQATARGDSGPVVLRGETCLCSPWLLSSSQPPIWILALQKLRIEGGLRGQGLISGPDLLWLARPDDRWQGAMVATEKLQISGPARVLHDSAALRVLAQRSGRWVAGPERESADAP